MQIESIALVLRPRSVWEGCDLGVRLLQSWLRPVFACHLAVVLPWFALCLASGWLARWLPALLIWLGKPWIDRTILFALSRALFGAVTGPSDLWAARRAVWLAGLWRTLTLQRLSASRAFLQPILQLEGLSGAALRTRVRQLAERHRSVARATTLAFVSAELALVLSLLALDLWLAPRSWRLGWNLSASALRSAVSVPISVMYGASVAFLEPFYVAAGFGMYVNRRVELEAWDIEQEFRRAFA